MSTPMQVAPASSVSFASAWPKVGTVVTFWCAKNDEAAPISATVATYREIKGERVFNLAVNGQVFKAKFIRDSRGFRVAPLDDKGEAPVSYPCRLKAPNR